MTATTPPGAAAAPTLSANQVLPLLDATLPGMVTVVAASPGAGKSTAMYHAIAHRMAEHYWKFSPRPYRVLWATHGTHDDGSLGQEARRELGRALMALGLPYRTKVLYGEPRFRGKMANYLNQFDWSVDPEATVRVISHAHLPGLLNQDAPEHAQELLRGADLIVVDEDPLFSLTFSLEETGRPFGQDELEKRAAAGVAGQVEMEVLGLMQGALSSGLKLKPLTVEHPITEEKSLSLTGRAFWEGLRAILVDPPDWDTFTDTLAEVTFTRKLPATLRDDLAAALKEDWNKATLEDKYSNRFGLTWQNNDPATMRLRADVLRSQRPDTPPIIVLDAYADGESGQYQRLFPNHLVQVERIGSIVPLDVEINTDWSIGRTNLTSSRQQPRRNHMMDEVGRLTESSPRGSLVLTYSKVVTYLSQSGVEAHWKRHAPSLNQAAPKGKRSIEFTYWFAGRGVNAYSGRHVIALHAPERPSLFEHHLLAALEPYDAARRAQLARHLRDTELLQMLHRGRQVRFPVGHPERPRVILAFKPKGALTGWVRLTTPPPSRPVRKNTTNLHHQHALDTLAGELHELLGAVPHVCLSVLGLYTPSKTEALHIEKAKSALKRLARHKKRKAEALDGWGGKNENLTARFSPYGPLSGDKPKRVLAAMFKSEHEALKHLRPFTVETSWPGGETRVYATDEESAEAAIRRLGG